jgi:methylmalonyl-CoA mutase
MNTLYKAIMDKVHEKTNDLKSTFQITREMSENFRYSATQNATYLKLLRATEIRRFSS